MTGGIATRKGTHYAQLENLDQSGRYSRRQDVLPNGCGHAPGFRDDHGGWMGYGPRHRRVGRRHVPAHISCRYTGRGDEMIDPGHRCISRCPAFLLLPSLSCMMRIEMLKCPGVNAVPCARRRPGHLSALKFQLIFQCATRLPIYIFQGTCLVPTSKYHISSA